MEKTSDKPLATVQELMEAWKILSADEQSRAEALLLQASNYLRLVAKNNDKDIDEMIAADEAGIYEANVKAAIMAAVQRSMATPTEMAPDANSWSQSATPYSEAMSFSGDVSSTIYFKARELQLLGLGSVSGGQNTGILRGVRG